MKYLAIAVGLCLIVTPLAHGADAVKAKSCSAMSLSNYRADNDYGYRVSFRDSAVAYQRYADVWSKSGLFKSYGTFSAFSMAIQFDENDSSLNIQSGDTISITFVVIPT